MTEQILDLLSRCALALPVWLALRGGWLLLRRERPRLMRELAMGAFAVFMSAVLGMALRGAWQSPDAMLAAAAARVKAWDRIHLVPFRTIGPQLRTLGSMASLRQLLGNILLFAPWGFFLPLLWPRFRRPLRMAGMALLLTCFIEGTQLFIDRYVEVDDVLLNFLGSMLGTGAWWCVRRSWPQVDSLFDGVARPSV